MRQPDLKNCSVAIIGTGYVADFYMRSLADFPDIQVLGAFDIDEDRLGAFCSYWKTEAFASQEALLSAIKERTGVVLNLTNPHAHYDVNMAVLKAGVPLYCEKPLAMTVEDARHVVDFARENGVMLGAAPCSWLGQSAQSLIGAVKAEAAGTARLVYAELDDGFIPQAPYQKWLSESGAPWPAEDEFRVGCTLEHAGYYLTWLLAAFGPIKTVVAASDHSLEDLPAGGFDPAPDMSVAMLKFESGIVARLTCSIVARHDHAIRIFCDRGTLELDECWDNYAPVKFRKRFTLRRRLIESPIRQTVKPRPTPWPKPKRRGAASMNFALGVVDMLDSLKTGRPSCFDPDFCLHFNEVSLAIQNAGMTSGAQQMTSRFELSRLATPLLSSLP